MATGRKTEVRRTAAALLRQALPHRSVSEDPLQQVDSDDEMAVVVMVTGETPYGDATLSKASQPYSISFTVKFASDDVDALNDDIDTARRTVENGFADIDYEGTEIALVESAALVATMSFDTL